MLKIVPRNQRHVLLALSHIHTITFSQFCTFAQTPAFHTLIPFFTCPIWNPVDKFSRFSCIGKGSFPQVTLSGLSSKHHGVARQVISILVHACCGTVNKAFLRCRRKTTWRPGAFRDMDTSESNRVVLVVNPGFKLGIIRTLCNRQKL